MTSNNSSNDPLASVITQVQPGQGGGAAGSAALRGAGPARPTRVAKPGTAKAAQQQQEAAERKKKKKAQQAAASAGAGTQPPSTASTTATGQAAGEEVAGPSTTTPTASTLLRQEGAEGHSNDPSSTLIGTTSTMPEGSAAAAEKGATPGAAGVGETDAAAKIQAPQTNEQDMTGAAQALASDKKPSTAAATASSKPQSKPTTPAAAATSSTASKPAQKQKTSPLKKLIAFLTCSGGASAAMAAEDSRTRKGDEVEMSTRNASKAKSQTSSASSPTPPQQQQGAAASGKRSNTNKLAPPVAATPTGKSRSATGRPSRPSSARNSLEGRSETGVVAPAPGTPTAGGGTMLPREETGDVMSGAVVPPGSSFVSPHDVTPSKQRGGAADTESDVAESQPEASSTGDDDGGADESGDELVEDYLDDEELNEEQRLIAQGGMGIPKDEYGQDRPLLPPLSASPQDVGRKCLVLDLDETLVHSSFKMIQNADFIVPVEIEGTVHNVYVIKRPGVDEFMRLMGEIYEVVVFTASLSKYADPVLDILDIHHVVRHRLFRESCYNHRGNYVKDLSQLGRPIAESIIIDNSPASYIFHPNNAVPISSWFNDPHDTELTDLCPFLADLSDVHDVRAVLDGALAAAPATGMGAGGLEVA